MKQGNILYVNLSNSSFHFEQDYELFDKYLGGTAVATELLFRHGSPDKDPYDSDAPIIFAIGPFNGIYPVATKTVAMFKSPLSGELGESHAGGRMAMALRDANIDAIVITGKANDATYLVINDDDVRFASAKTFVGKSSAATERILKQAEGQEGRKLSILRIGPAGERLSPMACAVLDGSRHFGRLGLGAVMGSKNLKAMVMNGTKGVPIDDTKAVNQVYDEIYERVVSSKEMKKYHDLGTASNVVPLSQIDALPTRNFSQGSFEGAHLVSGEAFAKDHLVQHTACAHCQCGCIHLALLKNEFKQYHYTTTKVSYDYELVYSLGTALSISSPQDILRLIYFVEKQGWDAISMGITLAWAAEAYVKGVITKEETAGLSLAFGDAQGLLKALEYCAQGRNEFFKTLEQGSDACAQKYGGADFAIRYGGVEPGGYLTGENFIITSVMGVRHSHLDDFAYTLDQRLKNAQQPLEEQVRDQVQDAQWRMVLNSLTLCLFGRGVYTEEIIVKGLKALGLDWDIDKLKELATKTLQRKHEWKKLCGFDADKVYEAIPEKMYHVHSCSGISKKENIKKRIDLYRELAGI